jgi:hypothetical protein
MNEKDIDTNTVVLFLVNRELLEKKCPMGWDGISKKCFRSMRRVDCQNFPSHPVPWDAFQQICVPWHQWDGTGRDRPVPRGALIPSVT